MYALFSARLLMVRIATNKSPSKMIPPTQERNATIATPDVVDRFNAPPLAVDEDVEEDVGAVFDTADVVVAVVVIGVVGAFETFRMGGTPTATILD